MKNSNNELIALAHHIKHLRTTLALSQEELAFRCNLTRNQISRIELGYVNVGFITLIKLAKILPLDLNSLLKPPTEAQ